MKIKQVKITEEAHELLKDLTLNTPGFNNMKDYLSHLIIEKYDKRYQEEG